MQQVCAVCNKFTPVFDKISIDFSDVGFIKVLTDNFEGDVTEIKCMHMVPIFRLYLNGTPIAEIVGAIEEELRIQINKFNSIGIKKCKNYKIY